MDLADPLVDTANTVALYSQAAGVLAGFAFTGLLLYLNRTPDEPTSRGDDNVAGREPRTPDVRRDVAVVLFNTLGALMICCLLYAQLAGEPPTEGVALSNVFVDGAAFTLALLGMFYATALAATSFAHLEPMVSTARVVVGVVGPAICMVFNASSALDIDNAKCAGISTATAQTLCRSANQLRPDRPYGLGLVLTGALFIISLALLIAYRRPSRQVRRRRTPTFMATLILGVAGGAVAADVYLTAVPDRLLPDDALRTILIATFAILIAFSAMTARSCHTTTPSGAV